MPIFANNESPVEKILNSERSDSSDKNKRMYRLMKLIGISTVLLVLGIIGAPHCKKQSDASQKSDFPETIPDPLSLQKPLPQKEALSFDWTSTLSSSQEEYLPPQE